MIKEKVLPYLRIFCALCLVATTMAVACPQPEPPEPQPPEPDPRSQSQILFEMSDVIGLYIKTEGVILYDQDQCQISRNDIRKVYRIQSDDQRRFVNLAFPGDIPNELDEGAFCTITYRLETGEENNVIIKLTLVKREDGQKWLWNDIQEIGVIIFE